MKIILSFIILSVVALNISFGQIDSVKRLDSLYLKTIKNRFDMLTNRPSRAESLPGEEYTHFNGENFGYGIPWTRVIDETVETNGVIIQNSLPKGSPYTDANGNRFGYAIFWTRVINETATPLELRMSFSGDLLSPSPDSYLKLFLPPDTMTIDKVLLYDYGATGLKSFLDTGINNPTMLQRTINPKENFLFYVVVLFYQGSGVSRAGLVLKGQDLFYRLGSMSGQVESVLIPCGQIVIKE